MHPGLLIPVRQPALPSGSPRQRFVFPELGAAPLATDPSPIGATVPDMWFGEDDLARAMALAASRAAQAARTAATGSMEASMCLATARLADELAALTAARRAETAAMRDAIRQLFSMFARACLEELGGPALTRLMVQAVERILAELEAGTEVLIEVAPILAQRIEALLVAQAGDDEGLRHTVRGRTDLAPGDVALSWRDGWAEWSFDRLRGLFSDEFRRLHPGQAGPVAGPVTGETAGSPPPAAFSAGAPSAEAISPDACPPNACVE